jgi:CheY-like chemotaxis protein
MGKSELNIMLIDDNEMFRKFLRKLLEVSLKTSVIEAENPKDAISYLENSDVDLIFLDMQMPVMDGLMALKLIRANTRFKETPVIACSALSAPKLLLELGKLGISDFIVKPSSPGIIIQKVKKIIVEQYSDEFLNPIPHNFEDIEVTEEQHIGKF